MWSTLGAGEGGPSASTALGQQVIFEMRHTRLVTQFTLTANANNFGLESRTIWQGFEAELSKHNFLYPCLLSIDNFPAASPADFTNYRACATVTTFAYQSHVRKLDKMGH